MIPVKLRLSKYRCRMGAVAMTVVWASATLAAEPIVIDLWSDQMPGDVRDLPSEADQTKPADKLIAGRPIVRLGNVSRPQIAVYRPDAVKANGAAMLICPGGGHHILAYDLEGIEVAQWCNSIGITGIVLKYRVPFHDPERKWTAAVQDTQRAMSLVRARADRWNVDRKRIGICGFSAGGQAAALASVFSDDRQYKPIDDVDQIPSRPDYMLLVYPGGLVQKDTSVLHDYIKVSKDVPPTFFTHAFDDFCPVENTLSFANAIKAAGGSAELHVFPTGGHGYGLRQTDELVTRWPELAESWLRRLKVLSQ